jgi:hypothetical protein
LLGAAFLIVACLHWKCGDQIDGGFQVEEVPAAEIVSEMQQAAGAIYSFWKPLMVFEFRGDYEQKGRRDAGSDIVETLSRIAIRAPKSAEEWATSFQAASSAAVESSSQNWLLESGR